MSSQFWVNKILNRIQIKDIYRAFKEARKQCLKYRNYATSIVFASSLFFLSVFWNIILKLELLEKKWSWMIAEDVDFSKRLHRKSISRDCLKWIIWTFLLSFLSSTFFPNMKRKGLSSQTELGESTLLSESISSLLSTE